MALLALGAAVACGDSPTVRRDVRASLGGSDPRAATGSPPAATAAVVDAPRARVQGQFSFLIDAHAQAIAASFSGDLDANLAPATTARLVCDEIAAHGAASTATLSLPSVSVEAGEMYGLLLDLTVQGYAGPGTYTSRQFAPGGSVVITNRKVGDVEAELRPDGSAFTLTMGSDGSGRLVIVGHNAMVPSQAANGSVQWSCAKP